MTARVRRWSLELLGDLARFEMGQAPPATSYNHDGVGTPFVRAGEFGRSRPRVECWTTAPLKFARASDVLLCVVGATAGKVNLGVDAAIGRSVAAISPGDRLDQRFLFHLLSSQTLVLRGGSRGSAQGVISKKDMGRIAVPLPSLTEQRRVVEILDDLHSRLDAGENGVRAAIMRSRALVKASAATLVGRVENDATVPTVGLARIATIGSGSTPKRGTAKYWDNGTIPWITSGDLSQGLISRASQFITEKALAETSVRLWPSGTLLIAMYGEGKTRGTVGELAIDSTTNQACAAVHLHDGSSASRAWLRLVLESRYDALRRESRGGVQPNLTLGYFKSLEVPWPDPPLAAALVKEHRENVEIARRLGTALLENQQRSAALRRSLFTAAFTGKLSGTESDIERVEEVAGV
ncbi:restriction endonuclease subunit S [Isoptericola sp. NPDC019571]|uniref:restriction endonuclease subunit S n=1 Tax=Isoptericola sp. NPDC019571 TaxID=3364008 RepID=UPI00378B2F40